MADVPGFQTGFIVDPSGRALIPLTGGDDPRVRMRRVAALPLPSWHILAPPSYLAAPDGAVIADPGGVMVGRGLLYVSRMLAASRAAFTR